MSSRPNTMWYPIPELTRYKFCLDRRLFRRLTRYLVFKCLLQTPEFWCGKSVVMKTTGVPNTGRQTLETWSRTPVFLRSSPLRILLWSLPRQPAPLRSHAGSGSSATALWVHQFKGDGEAENIVFSWRSQLLSWYNVSVYNTNQTASHSGQTD